MSPRAGVFRFLLLAIAMMVPTIAVSAGAPSAAPNPWLAVDRNRAAIVDAVVTRFGKESSWGESALRESLARLRADQLFSASLAGSIAAVESILAEADVLPGSSHGVRAKLGSTRPDLTYTPIVPCRIVDTRSGAGGTLTAGATRNWLATNPTGNFVSQGASASNCGMPVKAAAVMVNITVFNTSVGPAFITAWPFGQARPGTATLNWTSAGAQVANGAAIPLCSGGSCTSDFSLYASSATDLVVDAVGYFTAPTGGYVYSVAPSGAQFSSIQAAIDAAAALATSDQPYLVKIAPGSYTEQVTLKDFVDVEGSGAGTTVIYFDTARPTVTAGAFSEVRNVVIANAAPGLLSAGNGAVAMRATAASAQGFTRMIDSAVVSFGPDENLGVDASGGGVIHVLRSDISVGGATNASAAYGVRADAPGLIRVGDSRIVPQTSGPALTAVRLNSATMRINNTRMDAPTQGTPGCYGNYTPGMTAFTCN